MTDEVIKQAIKLRDSLRCVSEEIARRRDGNTELNALDSQTCTQSAEMLQKLGTEVTRLRLAIGHFMYGRLERHDLREIAESWNNS